MGRRALGIDFAVRAAYCLPAFAVAFSLPAGPCVIIAQPEPLARFAHFLDRRPPS
jgi:hypothetical protein